MPKEGLLACSMPLRVVVEYSMCCEVLSARRVVRHSESDVNSRETRSISFRAPLTWFTKAVMGRVRLGNTIDQADAGCSRQLRLANSGRR